MAVDTSGDLELARRLQEQEEEEAGITQSMIPRSTSSHSDEGGGGRGGHSPGTRSGRPRTHHPEHNRVRATFVNDAVHGQVEQSTAVPNPKLAAYFSLFFYLPCIIAVIVVFSLVDDPFDCGGGRLPIFSVIVAFRMAVSIFVVWVIYCYSDQPIHSLGCLPRTCYGLYRPLGTFSLVWFIVGNIWFFRTDSDDCNDHIYNLSLSLLVVHYVMFLLPCLLLIILIPVAYCCFPLYMRFHRVIGPHHPGRGMASDQLDQIRCVRFEENMFGEEETDNTCPITQEPYNVGDEVRVLPCGHHFSKSPIDEWLQTNNSCPLCREPVQAENSGTTEQTGATAASQTDTSSTVHPV